MKTLQDADPELSGQIRDLHVLIESKFAEGLFGRADSKAPKDELDDEVAEISYFITGLEKRISALPAETDTDEGLLSAVRNAYRLLIPDERTQQVQLIKDGIQKLHSRISKTSTRREQFKLLYSWVFHKNLCSPEPGVLGYRNSCKPTLSAYNMTTLGITGQYYQPALQWTTSKHSNGILDSIRIQELTLRSLARRMVLVLESAHKTSASKGVKNLELIEGVGSVLQDTIIRSRRFARVRISIEYLIELASYCITLLELIEQSTRSSMLLDGAGTSDHSIYRLTQKLQAWRDSLEALSKLQAVADSSFGGDKTLGSSNNALALFGSALIEEAWRWNASDDELSAWTSGQKVVPLDWLCRDGLRVVSDQLTYRNICKKIEANLKVNVLFDHSRAYPTYQYSGVRGGFGCVKRVSLENPIKRKLSNAVQVLIGRCTTELIYEVAVKVIYVGESEQATCLRIAREARAWAQLKHNHINPLLGLWVNFEGSPSPSFVSPWASQGSLPVFLKNNPRASVLHRLQIMRDVADALAFMHGQEFPVVHGDLRGSNVLIHHNEALVCDFGISYIADGLTGTTTAVHGSWKWWAPEYFHTSTDKSVEGTHTFKPTPPADVYSLASVFVEAFTGREPWDGVNIADRAVRRLDKEPQPKEICKDYWDFLTECWSPDPNLRPTAREVFEKMQTFVREADIEVID